MPQESRLVGYADNVAAFVAGRIAEQAQSRLGILMRRVSGLLMVSTLHWKKPKYTLGKELYRKRLAQLQRRGALRVASAYHTVSKLAVLVIPGVIPVAHLAKGRQAIYKRKGEEPREVVAREERTLDEWQLSWQN